MSCRSNRTRFVDTELDENVKPLVYKCRERVLQIASSGPSFRIDDYKDLQSSALSFLLVKKENIKSHSSELEHLIHKARWMAKLMYFVKFGYSCAMERVEAVPFVPA